MRNYNEIIKNISEIRVKGNRNRNRPKNKWMEVIKKDMEGEVNK